jgi:hypothetical protein
MLASVPIELSFFGEMCRWEALFPLLSATMQIDNNVAELKKWQIYIP